MSFLEYLLGNPARQRSNGYGHQNLNPYGHNPDATPPVGWPSQWLNQPQKQQPQQASTQPSVGTNQAPAPSIREIK